MKIPSKRGDRRGMGATALAAVLILSGSGLIGIALASQSRVAHVPRDSTHRAPAPSIAVEPPELGLRRLSTAPAGAPDTYGPLLARSVPVVLDIPSIDVHSVLQRTGLTETGALEVPAPGPHYDEAAWYRHSPTPGELGPAVVLGHIDSAAGGPSVFFRLGELVAGDEVSITRADGSTAVFEVDEVHSYPKNDFPTELVYGDIDHAGLRILTCGGAFDDSIGHYEDNVVVFASLVTS